MAAPKPTMRRRTPSSAALEFVEGKSGAETTAKKPRKASNTSGRAKPGRKGRAAASAKSKASSTEGEERIPKRLYLPKEVEIELRLRAVRDGVQQSEIATEALRAFLGL